MVLSKLELNDALLMLPIQIIHILSAYLIYARTFHGRRWKIRSSVPPPPLPHNAKILKKDTHRISVITTKSFQRRMLASLILENL